MGKSLKRMQAEMAALDESLAAARQQRGQAEAVLADLLGTATAVRDARRQWRGQVERACDGAYAAALASVGLLTWAGWDDPRWAGWQPSSGQPDQALPACLRIGMGGRPPQPYAVPFIGHNKTVILLASEKTAATAKALMQSLVVRIALAMPHQARFTLIDPVQLGRSFPMRAYLPQVRPHGQDPSQDLQTVIDDIARIGSQVLKFTESFEKLPPETRAAERFECVFVTDFGAKPTVESRFFDRLVNIGVAGPQVGRYLFLHVNRDLPLPRDIDLSRFTNAEIVDLDECGLALDGPPAPERQVALLEAAAEVKQPESTFNWTSGVGLSEDGWWRTAADQMIETPVGDGVAVWFGQKGGANCAHGVLAGTTGSGKSNFLHVMITGLAVRYSPRELQFYLVDGKSGVEFNRYRGLPHARVVSLRTAPVFAQSVLADLAAEMERRYALFGEAGVQGLADFRRKRPDMALPRLLLVVDEYQQLFENDPETASALLGRLSDKGRAAGVHLFLASQRFTAHGMLYADKIFTNIGLRIALMMPDAAGLTEFGPRGKQMIKELDKPGMVVVNDRGGDDTANQRGMVAGFDDGQADRIVAALAARAAADPACAGLPAPVVFSGDDQPRIAGNRLLRDLLERPARPTAAELETLARREARDGGLGKEAWLAAERPLALWLGQEFNVHGHAVLALRRGLHQNALLIGSDAPARYGMLAGALSGLPALHGPQDVRLIIVDGAIPHMPGHGALAAVADGLLRPLGYDVTLHGEAARAVTVLQELATELAARKDSGAAMAGQPSLLVVMTDLDRAVELARDPSRREAGTPYELFRQILREGPSCGIHLLLSLSSIHLLGQFLDERRDLQQFTHRIALQMSDADSRAFVGNGAAARLSAIGSGKAALLLSMTEGLERASWFKPYDMIDPAALSAQADELRRKLEGRA